MRIVRPKPSWAIAILLIGFGYVTLAVLTLEGRPRQTNADQTPASELSSAVTSHRAFFQQHCIFCHNDRLRTAGLSFENADLEHVARQAELWEKVALKLRQGAMPPRPRPRPDRASVDELVQWLEAQLDSGATTNPRPGQVGVHRLNRAEYANAIRDLLGLELDSRSVLIDEDASLSGFSNTAGALPVTPALIDRYIAGARRISRLAVGDTRVSPAFETYDVPKMLVQDDRMSEDLPFASRGGVAIRHTFPVDGEYVVKIRLRVQIYSYIIGLGRPHPLEVRLDGQRIKQFIVGGDAPGRAAPDSFAGNHEGDPDWEYYMHFADSGLEVRFHAQAGTRVIGISFAEYTAEPEGVAQPPQTGASGIQYNHLYYENPQIRSVAIGGPFNVQGPGETESRRRIFVCRPKRTSDENGCARMILSTLARRAYRRPLTEADVSTLMRFYAERRQESTFEEGIQSALARILVDPEFLVRIERHPPKAMPGQVYRLDDLALASRLSFFLWSSIPDDELLELAARQKLHDPVILKQQVRRMYADGRSQALIDDFVSPWLGLTKLRGAAPDPDLFLEFDENLREAFQQETRLFVESQMLADASVTDLFTANYTFVNERLARHYRIPDVYGEAFRRVMFTDGRRGGLLGQGSLLTVTSYANRTSPVLRGKWVLENLLATPPPPPPPNVPRLPERGEQGAETSVRERLELHRRNPVCATCHSQMDPLGFALENFDGVGQWRTTDDDGTPINASDTLSDGTQLSGVTGLRQLLVARKTQFVRAVTEKLLAYALGRNVEYYDLPAVRQIERESTVQNYRWSSIIEGVVTSVPFQMSLVPEESDSTSAAASASITRPR